MVIIIISDHENTKLMFKHGIQVDILTPSPIQSYDQPLAWFIGNIPDIPKNSKKIITNLVFIEKSF